MSVFSLEHRHIYLDANVMIAAIERKEPGAEALLGALERQECVGTTSELTLAEVLSGPLARHETAPLAAYEALFAQGSALQVLPITRAILRRAAGLRGMDLPDAIHVATAISVGCDVIASDDQHLRLPAMIERVSLAQLAPSRGAKRP